jgi:hypothetical protein
MGKALNDLPVIIDGPGLYKARNGKLVTVHEIRQPPPESGYVEGCGMTTFPAKASLWSRGFGQINPPYEAFHLSGRVSQARECEWDIISKEADHA